jgi:hypothetical protein
MKYLIVATAICVLFAVLVLTESAFADRESARDTFEYIGNAGNCRVYHKRHNNYVVFVTWGTHCAVSAT